jgi:SAM-dependent methyltransferase
MPKLTPVPDAAHAMSPPSAWIARWSPLLRPGSTVLDVACGSGRHLQWFAERGHTVCGVDRDIAAAQAQVPGAQLVEADIENGPWPLVGPAGLRQFDAVVVTNYLWRPLLPTLLQSLAPGGLLLYETFAAGHASVGRPARPDFLLQPGELLQLCSHLQVVAYENGFLDHPPRFVQRVAAFAPALPVPGNTAIARHLL